MRSAWRCRVTPSTSAAPLRQHGPPPETLRLEPQEIAEQRRQELKRANRALARARQRRSPGADEAAVRWSTP